MLVVDPAGPAGVWMVEDEKWKGFHVYYCMAQYKAARGRGRRILEGMCCGIRRAAALVD